MPYLRRLVLLLTLSTSLLLVTVHLLHFSRPHHQEPLHPVISKEEAEKEFSYLKQYDHPIEPQDLAVPSRDYANKIAYGKDPPVPPRKEDVQIPEQKDSKPKPADKPVDQQDSKPVSKPADQKDSKPDSKPKFKFNELPPDGGHQAEVYASRRRR